MSHGFVVPLRRFNKKLQCDFAVAFSDEDNDLREIAWSSKGSQCKYAAVGRTVGGKNITFYAHRIVLMRMLGRLLVAGECVDHINGNTFDNTRGNLRLVTSQQNNQNRTRLTRNKSGYRGVCWDKRKKKWHAGVVVKGRTITLGRYDDLHEAGRVAAEGRRKHGFLSAECGFMGKD